MPTAFLRLAREAASDAGYPDFIPDANRYVPGARLTLHQDKNERDFDHPIVSVSLGLPAVFRFGGLKRSAPVAIRLERQFAEVGVEVDYFSYTQATSSSLLRRTLQNIDELARSATGRPLARLAA